MAWGFIAGAVITTGVKAVQANQQRQAAKGVAARQQQAIGQQQDLLDNLKYTPIDIEKLKTDTAALAAQNAAASLQLERDLQPNVAATREGLSKTVNEQLAMGGKLSPDIANAVAQQARVRGSSSGAEFAPITAALTGQSAQQLLQQRIGNATALTAANPLPVAGLDPGALASIQLAENNAVNQFNFAKAGGQSNLINSSAQVDASRLTNTANANSSQIGMWGSIMGQLVGGGNSGLGKLGGQIGSLFTAKNPNTSPYNPKTGSEDTWV